MLGLSDPKNWEWAQWVWDSDFWGGTAAQWVPGELGDWSLWKRFISLKRGAVWLMLVLLRELYETSSENAKKKKTAGRNNCCHQVLLKQFWQQWQVVARSKFFSPHHAFQLPSCVPFVRVQQPGNWLAKKKYSLRSPSPNMTGEEIKGRFED